MAWWDHIAGQRLLLFEAYAPARAWSRTAIVHIDEWDVGASYREQHALTPASDPRHQRIAMGLNWRYSLIGASALSPIVDTDGIALEMKAAQDSGTQISPITSSVSGFDLSVAYQVANKLHRLRLEEGEIVVGKKIGFTNPDMWAQYGVSEPVWAYVYDSTVEVLSETRMSCALGGFAEPKIEPEIVFSFRKAIHSGANETDILNALDWVAHGYEVVQSHFPGWKFQAADTVADWALHARLLVGPPIPIQALGNDPKGVLGAFELTLLRGGVPIEVGKGSNVLGNPVSALAHLVAVLAKQLDGPLLNPGDVVTTGTITKAHPVEAGESWQSELEGIALPGLTVDFTT